MLTREVCCAESMLSQGSEFKCNLAMKTLQHAPSCNPAIATLRRELSVYTKREVQNRIPSASSTSWPGG